MGRLETQQRGDNVCILKGWNAILQQAASGYEMNNDIATTVGLNLNITNFELLWTLQLGWDLELFPTQVHSPKCKSSAFTLRFFALDVSTFKFS